MSELSKRIIVGVLLIVLAVVDLWVGGFAFWSLAAIAAILMLREYGPLVGADDGQVRISLLALTIVIALLSPWASGPSLFTLGALVGMVVAVGAVTRHVRLAVGLAYVGLPVVALVWLRSRPEQGLLLAFWALSLVWATDIGAYFSGRAIGGPKIAPSISPNKTWAGLIGGMITSLALGLILNNRFGLPLGLAIASPGLAIIAQIGDFYESQLKRSAGVKDSGKLLPGHGGALDRLDGVVTVAPVAALIVAFGLAA
jgi:phosphatidate cytidylyltransferase